MNAKTATPSQGASEAQVQALLATVKSLLAGDFSARLAAPPDGTLREVADALNQVMEQRQRAPGALLSNHPSQFLANMSHELRTPLNSLLILAKLLSENKEANLTPSQLKWAGTIHAAGCDLLALTNDILDLAKVEAGKMPVVFRNFLVADLWDALVECFRPVAEQKRLRFTLELAPDFPQRLTTDLTRLTQILRNLLSNAFKFTDQGEVKLIFCTAEDHPLRHGDGPRGRMLSMAVWDTGIGIPPDKQNLVFDAFQQAENTTSHRYGGTGLGLTISRQLTRLLGGALDVESTPGVGSRFTLYLPERH